MANPNKAIIHDLCVKRLKTKTRIAAINADLKIEKKALMDLDIELLNEMNEAQQTMTRVEGHTVSITTQDLFSAPDWKIFDDFAIRNKAAYLYQRRLNQPAIEEAIALYGADEVPVEKFTKTSISVRKVPGAK